MEIMNFFRGSEYGNALSIISIVTGIISIILTFITWKKAKEIDEVMKASKIEVLNKNHFYQEKTKLEQSLISLGDDLIRCEKVNNRLAKRVFNEICSIKRYSVLFHEADRECLENLTQKQRDICEAIRTSNPGDHQLECIEIVNLLKEIIQRGEYGV